MNIFEKLLNKNLNTYLETNDITQKKIVLFGKNYPAVVLEKLLTQKGYTIYAIVDNNPYSIGETIGDITVCTPEDALLAFDEDIIIFIASRSFSAMKSQLRKMGYGYKNEQIISLLDFDDAEKKIKASLGNVHFLTLKEVQEESFKILCLFDEICKQNNLTYFLAFETLLGAVRHKEFIPWDDDIDVAMPYPDFLKLKKIIQKNEYCKNGKYLYEPNFNHPVFYKFKNTEFPCVPLAFNGVDFNEKDNCKLALSIDIYPIFSIPDEKKEAETLLKRDAELKIDMHFRYNHIQNSAIMSQAKEELIKLWDNIGYHKTNLVTIIAGYRQRITSYRVFDEIIPVEFCGKIFPAPIGYDEFLHMEYGNYMLLPPENERYPYHHLDCYKKLSI